MRNIREVLRLKLELKLGDRQTAQACRISRSTVSLYVNKAKVAGITWPLAPDLDDHALEELLFKHTYTKHQPGIDLQSGPGFGSESGVSVKPTKSNEPDWNHIHTELQRKGVTRLLLWREYQASIEQPLGYTAFTKHYRAWHQTRDLSMRQMHKAGEKIFVDYAGLTLPIQDASTGEITRAQIFVAAFGASNYVFVEATRSQSSEDWLGSHVRMLSYFGGVPEIIVPDNLKAGVTHPSFYEPELNRAYTEFAEHYGLAVIPARVRKPKDKAKVEVAVQIVEREILAPLRNRTFFDLFEINQAIQELLEQLNHKPFQKLEGCRASAFKTIDLPALKPLPLERFVISQWRKAKVNIDYHIEVDGHYYSVPYKFARVQVDLRLTSRTVEVFLQNKRIASHVRVADLLKHKGRHTTISEHMPKSHQRHGDWTPARLIAWAGTTGPFTQRVVQELLEARTHPEQGYRSCLGLLRLAKLFGSERLEAGCKRADSLGLYSYKSVQSILQKKLDLEPLRIEDNRRDVHLVHANLRGAAYYQNQNDQPLEPESDAVPEEVESLKA
jgi:transposase